MKLKPVRIGLWDQYGGSMPSGWTRWLFEQFEFPFEVVFPQTLDAGNLNAKFDVLVFVDGAHSGARRRGGGGGGFGAQPAAERFPAEFRGWLGRVTVAKTVPELKKFVENGGTILTIGSSTVARPSSRSAGSRRARRDASNGASSGRCRARSSTFPARSSKRGSTTRNPLAYGMDERAMVFFDESPAFRLQPEAGAQGREAGRVVRQRRRRCAAAGRGVSSTSIRRSRSSRRRSARAASCCSAPRSPGARSRTARSSCCSTASTTARATPAAAGDGRTTDQPNHGADCGLTARLRSAPVLTARTCAHRCARSRAFRDCHATLVRRRGQEVTLAPLAAACRDRAEASCHPRHRATGRSTTLGARARHPDTIHACSVERERSRRASRCRVDARGERRACRPATALVIARRQRADATPETLAANAFVSRARPGASRSR